MRYRAFVAGGAVALVVGGLTSAGCASTDQSDSCDRSEEIEDALDDLDQLTEDDTNMVNVDERLQNLGDDINEVMNTTDDENALQLRDLELRYQDLRDDLEDLGNADDLSETGDELDQMLSRLGDAIERMSDSTQEECTP